VEETDSTTQQVFLGTLQWGHGDEAVEEALARRLNPESFPGFNGATAMKPWKSWDGLHAPQPR